MADREETFLRLVECVYAAAEDESSWPVFLKLYADAVGGDASAIYFQELEGSANVSVMYNVDPVLVRSFESYYSSINPLLLPVQQTMREGDIGTSQALISDSQLERTEFYADWLAPQHVHHEMGSVVLKSDKLSAHLTVARRRSAGEFGNGELRVLKQLLPHVQRALRLHRLCRELRNEAAVVHEASDCVSTAILLIAPDGCILSANHAARRMLQARDPIASDGRELRLSDSTMTARLRLAIAQAANIWQEPSVKPATFRVISSNSKSYEVVVTPLARRDTLFGKGAAVAVTVPDPYFSRAEAIRRLVVVYGLTPAESRMAEKIVSGVNVKTAALELNISTNTAREYLKRVFSKTGVTRQAELVRLVG